MVNTEGTEETGVSDSTPKADRHSGQLPPMINLDNVSPTQNIYRVCDPSNQSTCIMGDGDASYLSTRGRQDTGSEESGTEDKEETELQLNNERSHVKIYKYGTDGRPLVTVEDNSKMIILNTEQLGDDSVVTISSEYLREKCRLHNDTSTPEKETDSHSLSSTSASREGANHTRVGPAMPIEDGLVATGMNNGQRRNKALVSTVTFKDSPSTRIDSNQSQYTDYVAIDPSGTVAQNAGIHRGTPKMVINLHRSEPAVISEKLWPRTFIMESLAVAFVLPITGVFAIYCSLQTRLAIAKGLYALSLERSDATRIVVIYTFLLSLIIFTPFTLALLIIYNYRGV